MTTILKSLLEEFNGSSIVKDHVSTHGDSFTHDTSLLDDCQPISDPPDDNGCSDAPPPCLEQEQESRTHRILPDEAKKKLYNDWLLLIPDLMEEYLGYVQRTLGRLGRSPNEEMHDLCSSGLCMAKTTSIQCLYFDCVFHPIYAPCTHTLT